MKHGLVRSALVLVTIASPGSLHAADFPETEDHSGVGSGNNTKTTAEVVVGMNAGDTISGISQATGTTGGNTITSADTWDISTAAQGIPGWYEWTLTISTSAGSVNSTSIRGLNQTGGGDCVNPSTIGALDGAAQADILDVIRWFSNEQPSRVYVRVTGLASSADYSAVLACNPVAVTSVGTFAAGPISFTTRGQGHTSDTDIALFDASRTVITGAQNDDSCIDGAVHSLGSDMTRTLSAGTYYIAVSNFNMMTNDSSPNDDDFGGANVLDFANALASSSTNSTNNLSFAIDDGSGPVMTAAAKTKAFDVRIFEFTVGASNLASFCFGDGGDQLGCTSCPCANNAPIGSGGGCLNSNGGSTGAVLAKFGAPDLTTPADTLRFTMTGANASTFGVLMSADNRLPIDPLNPCLTQNPGSGKQSLGMIDGLRCIGGNSFRHGARATSPSGTVGITNSGWGPPNNPLAGIGVTSGFLAGQTRHFQVFYRESATAQCMTGQNTTQGVTVTFL